MSKIRLDQYLCQNGLVQSRERAKALIMSGIPCGSFPKKTQL